MPSLKWRRSEMMIKKRRMENVRQKENEVESNKWFLLQRQAKKSRAIDTDELNLQVIVSLLIPFFRRNKNKIMNNFFRIGWTSYELLVVLFLFSWMIFFCLIFCSLLLWIVSGFIFNFLFIIYCLSSKICKNVTFVKSKFLTFFS